MVKYLHFLFAAAFVFFITAYELLPLQDYYQMLYQSFLFNQLAYHGNDFGGFFHFYPYIPPNIVSSVVLGTMQLILDPFVAGKVYMIAIALLLYSGIVRFIGFHTGKSASLGVLIAAFYLTYNLHYVAAYLNFTTGFGIALHLIALMRQKKLETSITAQSLALLLMCLCHFMVLSLYVLYFGVYFIYSKRVKDIWKFAAAGLPTLALLIHYTVMRDIEITYTTEDTRTLFHVINGKFLVFFTPIIPFQQFKWVVEVSTSVRILDYMFSISVFLSICYILIRCIRSKFYTFHFWLALTCLLLAFFLPMYFGGVILPGERFVVLCIVNIFILYRTIAIPKYISQVALTFGILLCAASFTYNMIHIGKFNTMIKNGDIPYNAIHNPNWKLAGTNGFLHFKYRDAIINKTPLPVFRTGMFGVMEGVENIR